MTTALTEHDRKMALHLAKSILDAFEGAPIIVGIAALISVTGSVCFNEAEGDVPRAKARAVGIASGVIDVIDKLHIGEEGDGDDR